MCSLTPLFRQIGNRPRDGAFGACFFISPHESLHPSRIYCARPGTRIWEVDFEGEVIQTHQFKSALATAPAKIYKPSDGTDPANDADDDAQESNDELLDYQPQHLQFAKLQRFSQDFLLAYTELGLYVFDVRQSSVVLWCNQFERIVDCRIAGSEIFVFTQTGSLYSVQLQTLQAHAISLMQQSKLPQCARLLRQHVKYFADKARENYDLKLLNQLKQLLIERQQYELLNDISVIFDAIAQCTGSALDTQSSGGSSATTERSASLSTTAITAAATAGNTAPPPAAAAPPPPPKGVYVLENAFCDNLKMPPKTGHFKDALLTVTGKFGKNIIKYKFNIFAEEQQQQLVRELIPASERSQPFKDIKARYESQDQNVDDDDEEIVCRSTSKRSAKPATAISPEEKTIYNLYLIHKGAKFSRTHCVERYRAVFDEYAASELIQLLGKLAKVMVEHGDSVEQAQRNCYEMYFNYLNPELIWEMDDATRDYIASGFVLLNSGIEIVRCQHCQFPLRFDNTCQYHELGAVLLRYFWSRSEQLKCFDVLQAVPALLDILAKFYMAEHNLDKVLPIVFNYGAVELLQDVGKQLNVAAWARLFEQFVELQRGRLQCVNCECVTNVEQEQLTRHFFYTWNCFLNIALDHLTATETLALIFKWSSYIPSDAIDREFYTRCLLKG